MNEEQLKNFSLLLYISKIIYPKYGPFWFICYMYLIYRRIVKRQLEYHINLVPNKLLRHCIKNQTYFNNINNTIIVNHANLYQGDKILRLLCTKTNSYRCIYVIPSMFCKDNEILMNYCLNYNLENGKFETPVQLVDYSEFLVKFADEIDLSLISNPHEINTSLSDSILERYFRTPKLVNKGDIIEIDVRIFVKDLFFLNSKLNSISCVYYKCNKVIFKNVEVHDTYFCAVGETAIKQSPNIQNFLPRKNDKVSFLKENEFRCIPLCPYGLQEFMDGVQTAVKPFLRNHKLILKPAFLLQGNSGSGKDILVSALASNLGMNFYKIYNTELMANVYAQNEAKLRNVFFNAKMAAPCIISIHNFENFGKNNDGQYDDRLINSFAEELDILFDKNQYPVLLFCCTTSKNLPVDLKKVFLETFEITAPTDTQREQNLKWILENQAFNVDVDFSEIVKRTHGFFFEDLRALVYYATKEYSGQEMFFKAIDFMQSNYNKSIGAPQVPKVNWADIGGLADIKEEIIKTINLPLKHPEFSKKSGLKRSGILLFGPPGTGKTLIAKAVATECNLCFLSVKGPELLNMYVGQSEQNIREVFDKAREASPCIIFFDELDSLAPNRGISGDSGGVMDRVVSQLLAEMDGLNKSATVFIIGATNRPDLIDPALLRPGRFDRLLYVGPCTDVESKLSVLKALTRKFNFTKDLDLREVVKLCPENITGADFYGICSTAWYTAVRRLIKDIETAQVDIELVNHKDVIVRIDDFKDAIYNVKPSITAEDLKYFQQLKHELCSSSNNK